MKDLNLPAPLDSMVPLAELDLHTGLDRGQSGRTTGTTNLGAVWVGNGIQIGVEAIVPVNERSDRGRDEPDKHAEPPHGGVASDRADQESKHSRAHYVQRSIDPQGVREASLF